MGVAVLLNNFFHDLSVALFTCALLGAASLWRAVPAAGPAARPVIEGLDRLARRVCAASFAGIILFGAVRAAAFKEYEWLPAAGRGLVPALIVKHVFLVILLAAAGVAAVRARRSGRAALGGSP